MELDAVLKQFKLYILILPCIRLLNHGKEMLSFLLTASNNFHFGSHLDIYEVTSFTRGIMTVTAKFYILMIL